MPTPDEPDDPDQSRYDVQRFHKVMAAALEEVELGRIKRLIISLPPRHGKTELASRRFIAWYAGRNPSKSVIFGTYNDKFSEDIGRDVRDVIRHPASAQVFPDLVLKGDSQASNRLQTTKGGVLAFVGRGGTTTGRGADLFVIDDPVKDSAEANSPTIRDQCWTWFNRVASTRLMTQDGCIVIIGTRWHEDDIIGRIIDPMNDFYDPEEARQWHIIDLPALAREHDILKRAEGEALWPSRFDAPFFEGLRRRDPRGFSALYQGRPSPEGGSFFKADYIQTYKKQDLPRDLRRYCSSDHAVSMLQGRDRTCLLTVGVDENDHIWVVDAVWRQMPTDKAVEAMLKMIQDHKPLHWWAERSHISKSVGPFLRKRMLETSTFCSIIEVTPLADKQTRAQSIQGRMAMHMVHFPENAPWWPMARDELLKFPHDAHDDFVDALALIGLGLQQLMPIVVGRPIEKNRMFSFGWLKQQRDDQRRQARFSFSAGGW
jgi:predicted phage terminase large subunit-like protein